MPDQETEIKVDIGVLKQQVSTLTLLCNKMDVVIDKLVDQHDRHITKVYVDMDRRRLETESDIKELHERIDTVLDKMQSSEIRIMEEISKLRTCMLTHNKEEKESLEKILQWKWMAAGGIVVLAWLFSHVKFDIIQNFFK